jgi:mono/diheme cytochrome c family protein
MKVNSLPHLAVITALLSACCTLQLSFASESSKTAKPISIAPTGFKPAAASAESEVGKKLAARQNCATCHSIEGKGGCLAPPFEGIGARRTRSYMLARLSSERQAIDEYSKLNTQGELFAHARVPAQQASSLVSYLLTIPEPAGGFQVNGHQMPESKLVEVEVKVQAQSENAPNAESIRQGKALFIKRNCLSCHSVGESGGQFAPDLRGIGKRKGRDYIVATLSAAENHTLSESEKSGDKIVMSPAAFSPAQIQKVADFLMSLPEATKQRP